MTSTNPKDPKTNSDKSSKRRRYTHFSYSAQQKVQAVLAVWTERCTAADICRQLNITAMTFHQWQQRAMQSMLQGLETHVNLAKGGALSPRLQALLQKHQLAGADKLSKRLEQIQNKVANPPENPQKS
jgi:transposase-like protein